MSKQLAGLSSLLIFFFSVIPGFTQSELPEGNGKKAVQT